MITLNAKEYLNRVRFADRLINVKDKELNRLRLSITQMSPQTNGDRVKSSNTTDFTQTVDKIVDLQNKWLTELANQGYCCVVCRGFAEAREEIEKYIVLARTQIQK